MPAQTAKTRTAYEILGVAPSADPATIRRAWVKLVKSYRPSDYYGDRAGALKRLLEIDAAFDVVDTRGAFEVEGKERAARKAEAIATAVVEEPSPAARPAPQGRRTVAPAPEWTPRARPMGRVRAARPAAQVSDAELVPPQRLDIRL